MRLYDVFRATHPSVTQRAKFDYVFIGRDWSGLLERVKTDPQVPSRAKVLVLLEQIVAERQARIPDSEENLLKLKRLDGGRPYAYLLAKLFPPLRRSFLTVEITHRDSIASLVTQAAQPTPLATTTQLFTKPYMMEAATLLGLAATPKRPFYMSLNTNLLYDLAAVPNIGATFYLGRGFSLGGLWFYSWWSSYPRNRFWRLYGGELDLRYWFGTAAARKPLTGHHIGLSASAFIFDFEWGARGYMGGHPGRDIWYKTNYAAWAEYGYSLPIAKRLNLDFTLGVGYVGGEYRDYLPQHTHYVWQSTRKLHYFGPTKAEVSLVWLIGRGNVNKKGGAQ